ncbi:glycosyltransferase [Desulfolutivibrio sulfoxidireducens]|nr:glycosyltransferase [Desulfolutivibrio sulfoxidireducens]
MIEARAVSPALTAPGSQNARSHAPGIGLARKARFFRTHSGWPPPPTGEKPIGMPQRIPALTRRPARLTIRPVSQVEPGGEPTLWRSLGERPWLECVPPGGQIPEGWVHLQGRLLRKSGSWAAFAHAETAGDSDAVATFELPVSFKGTINELLLLPEGVTRLFLEPMQGPGEFELGEFTLKPVGTVERYRRMYKRILAMYYKHPRRRRKMAGLHSRTVLGNLTDAYGIAGRLRCHTPSLPYDRWLASFDQLTDRDIAAISRDISRLRRPPRFVILLPRGDRDDPARRATMDSLARQLYPHYEVVSPDAWRSDGHPDTWFVLATPGMLLRPHALYWIARAARDNRRWRLIYADHDFLDHDGQRCDPVFKPDWSPELLRSTNYIGHAAAIRGDVLKSMDRPADAEWDIHGLLLRAGELIPRYAVGHVHAPLFHLPRTCLEHGGTAGNPAQVAAHLARSGVRAKVEPTRRGHCRIRYALPEKPPLVSIIIPTRDGLPVLRTCVESVLEKTAYRAFEIRIVDNQSREPETLDYFAALRGHPRVRVMPYPHPFNFSAINNHAAWNCDGTVLCLLNNDTEVIAPDWLEEMLGHLVQPGVGVVGAKLYYTDGRVQHAGDVVGPGGCANHLHPCIAGDDPGYCDRAILAQDLSAVTAACMLTWKDVYTRLGGFDAMHLPVAFNDVDYCLRVRQAGMRVIWTPYAELYHHESYSRGSDTVSPERQAQARAEVKFMRSRWKRVMRHDPFYNPNLNYARPDFTLNVAPLVDKPWMR